MNNVARIDCYVIYDHPSDYPEKFIVRGWMFSGGSVSAPGREFLRIVDTLEEARACIPLGYVLIPRDESDDTVIVESYI